MRILLVEDTPIMAKMASAVIRECMGEVDIVIAEDGKSAIEQATGEAFDLILMDFGLPDIDGLDVTVQLREAGLTTPIFGLTANAKGYPEEKIKNSGLTDCFEKPLTPDKINRALSFVGND